MAVNTGGKHTRGVCVRGLEENGSSWSNSKDMVKEFNLKKKKSTCKINQHSNDILACIALKNF